MRRRIVSLQNIATAFANGPASIALGLAILAAAMLWPGVPAVTAVALVALGATTAALARFRGSPVVLPIMLAHVFIYGGLYALFVGAVLHSGALRSEAVPGVVAMADLMASLCPVALALQRVRSDLGTTQSAE